jgi:phosphomannomutase
MRVSYVPARRCGVRHSIQQQGIMAFEIPSDLMVSVSGVRGRVGEGLTPEVVARFSAAFGAWVRTRARGGAPSVVVGRDSRTSGPMFERAVISALQSVGCDVVRLGVAPTPTTLRAIGYHGAAGAIVVTASHNPVEWNALKLASDKGMFLDGEESAEMRRFVDARPIPRAGWDELGRVSEDSGAVNRHIEAILALPYLAVEKLRARRFRVVLDAVRGAGGVFLPALLERLGCEVIGLNLEPDGRFPRAPEPVAANLGELEHRVREVRGDIGMATDPDADRLALVSNAGHAVGEDLTLALATMLVLRHRKGPVVTNLSTSRVLDDVCAAAGVSLERAPVGEINVARGMERAGAVIGGEGNGGVILPDLHLTRDSGVAAALALQLLLEEGKPFDRIVGDLPSYAIVKEQVPRETGSLESAFEALTARFADAEVDRQDGLRLEWRAQRQWLHLRASGTEPILRMIAEAPTERAARRLVEQAREALLERAG